MKLQQSLQTLLFMNDVHYARDTIPQQVRLSIEMEETRLRRTLRIVKATRCIVSKVSPWNERALLEEHTMHIQSNPHFCKAQILQVKVMDGLTALWKRNPPL